MEGTVYKSTGSWYAVKTDDGRLVSCRIKGKFRTDQISSTNPVAVGDRVSISITDHEEKGVIDKIFDRKNYIVRKSVNLSKQIHILAANIDLSFLLVTLNNPVTHPAFIDRFLATAKAFQVDVVLLFNKEDSYSDKDMEKLREIKSIYERIGYQCLEISALTGSNIDQVKLLMTSKVCMLSGHSGVGKSTLVNSLSPGLDIKTKSISVQHQQGQHTTTHAELHELDFDAKIIDTPGIRGFGMIDFKPQELGDYFVEFFAVKRDCKFNNCMHIDEPKCAVKIAIEANEIAPSRYKSYTQMIAGDDQHYRTDYWES
ncbi:MAG: ribosome small subunit-dependent GTPase A [Flavobacteriaceae bacterium]|nr:ribosome small subunit-dependent GTPase A [Flavobacteriaceae bacterium]